MNTMQFDIELSNLGIYFKAYANKVYSYKHSLFNFLNSYGMLKKEYKDLVLPHTKQQIWFVYIPVKMAKKIPFIVAASTCGQLNNCLRNAGNLNLVKNRVKNYYCEDFFKKIVSVFGNKKAWNEFKITSEWKPKFRFTRSSEYETSTSSFPYFKLITYLVLCRRKKSLHPYKGDNLISVCWDNNVETPILIQPHILKRLDHISKKKILKVFNNNSKKKVIENFREIIEAINLNKDLLTKDGLKLQKDLNLIRALVL